MLDGEESGKVSSYTCVMAQAVKNPSAGGSLQMGHRKYEFDPWVGKIPWRRAGQPTPVSLPREFHGQRSLAGYSPWDCKESDTAERLTLSLYKFELQGHWHFL